MGFDQESALASSAILVEFEISFTRFYWSWAIDSELLMEPVPE